MKISQSEGRDNIEKDRIKEQDTYTQPIPIVAARDTEWRMLYLTVSLFPNNDVDVCKISIYQIKSNINNTNILYYKILINTYVCISIHLVAVNSLTEIARWP